MDEEKERVRCKKILCLIEDAEGNNTIYNSSSIVSLFTYWFSFMITF